MLARLQALSNNHFGVAPETVNRGRLAHHNTAPKIRPKTPNILRAIGRALLGRRRMDAGEFTTIEEMAEAVGLAERHVSRQLRIRPVAAL